MYFFLRVADRLLYTDLMVWTRSSRDDFDRYASFSGDDSWSWDAVEPYFRKVRSEPQLVLASHV